MRAAASLHVPDVFRIRDVGDVEDAKTAQSIMADRVLHALRSAIEPSAVALTGNEKEISEDGNIALRRRAEVSRLEGGRARVGDIPDLITVVAALDRVGTRERQIGIRDSGELLGGLRRRHQPQVPGGGGSVELSSAETNAWIGDRFTGGHVGGHAAAVAGRRGDRGGA